MNHGLIPGGVSLNQNRQTCCVLHCCDSDGLSRWLMVKPCATCHKQESRHTEILGNAFRDTVFWCNLKLSSTNEDCNFIKQDQIAVILYDTLPAEFIEKRYA